jgi:hypothetical protein
MIDVEAFYLCAAQAVKTRAVVLVSKDEFDDRMTEEMTYLKQKQGIMLTYEPFAKLGYSNFIAVNDSPFMDDGVEIITLFEVIG